MMQQETFWGIIPLNFKFGDIHLKKRKETASTEAVPIAPLLIMPFVPGVVGSTGAPMPGELSIPEFQSPLRGGGIRPYKPGPLGYPGTRTGVPPELTVGGQRRLTQRLLPGMEDAFDPLPGAPGIAGKAPQQIFQEARQAFGASGGPREQFLKAHNLPSDTVVHHRIELQTLEKYPGLFTPTELNAQGSLRGIPNPSTLMFT